MKTITAFIQIVTSEHGRLNFAPSALVTDEYFNEFNEMLKSSSGHITINGFETILNDGPAEKNCSLPL